MNEDAPDLYACPICLLTGGAGIASTEPGTCVHSKSHPGQGRMVRYRAARAEQRHHKAFRWVATLWSAAVLGLILGTPGYPIIELAMTTAIVLVPGLAGWLWGRKHSS